MQARNKRPNIFQRKYLINKGFQLKYTFMVVGVCSVIYFTLGYYFYTTSLDNTDLLAIKNFELKGMVEEEDNFTLIFLAVAFVLQIGSLFVLGTLITHRIVGPTFVISRALDNLNAGKFQLMRPLRKKDEFHEFIDRINDLVTFLREVVANDIKAIEQLEAMAPKIIDQDLSKEFLDKLATFKADKAKLLNP